jgi:hypothetical protein
MFRYIPYALGLILLTGATWWQARIVDRWGMSSISIEELQSRFAKVPLEMGTWKGTDLEVKEEITDTAGAVAHVNRVYKNEESGEEVALWLIAGHAKDIVRHTPDICYPAQGYRQIEPREIPHPMETADGSEAVFWTARFTPEAEATAGQRRVFWAWSIDNEEGAAPKWEAPEEGARRRFGNTTALYKMYFTSVVTSRDETAANSPCAEFANVCIPEVNRALFGEASAIATPGAGAQSASQPTAQAAPGTAQ